MGFFLMLKIKERAISGGGIVEREQFYVVVFVHTIARVRVQICVPRNKIIMHDRC